MEICLYCAVSKYEVIFLDKKNVFMGQGTSFGHPIFFVIKFEVQEIAGENRGPPV